MVGEGAPVTLPLLIAELRADLNEESFIERMHGRGPAEGLNEEFDAKGWVRSPDEGGIGRPFSRPMWRLLGSPDGWGTSYLARASIQEISDRCHARHTEHQRLGDRFGTCARLVFRVVEMAQPVSFAAERMGLDPDKAADILLKRLTEAAEWRHNRLDDLRQGARVEKSAEFIPQEQFIIDHDSTDWERQKWDALRDDYHLPPWDIEWERRLAQHAKYGCSRCERIAA